MPPLPVTPCCANCGEIHITFRVQSYGGIDGVLVYCGDCGAIVSWSAKPVAILMPVKKPRGQELTREQDSPNPIFPGIIEAPKPQ